MIRDQDGNVDIKATARYKAVFLESCKQEREIKRGKLLTAIGGNYEGALEYALWRASKKDHERTVMEMLYYGASAFKPESFKKVFFRAFERVMKIQNAIIEKENA